MMNDISIKVAVLVNLRARGNPQTKVQASLYRVASRVHSYLCNTLANHFVVAKMCCVFNRVIHLLPGLVSLYDAKAISIGYEI
ncbi:MAG: hypothetical protein QOH96_2488 [Blastocatellia bacterium]|nr:hypothetical protein [Blastocatellia bacterium]